MSSILYKKTSSYDITKMPEIILKINTNQPLTTSTTMEDMNITTRFNDFDRIDDVASMIDKKQKSLISIYDNNPQQQQQPQQSYPLVGIIGRNKRSKALTKRLLLSGFPKPILCDINSSIINLNDQSNYVSYETFYQFSPSIILITDNINTNLEDLFSQDIQQKLIIDTREIISKNSSILLPLIPGSYRAFGNLSNWEIENGTQRIGVAVEQYSPPNLIKFIYDLKCSSHDTFFLDYYSYNNQKIKSFRNCLFPLISTIIIFSIWFILSIIEHNQDIYNSVLIYRQASSITASTSITLLALLFLIRPLLELIEFIYLIISKKQNTNENFIQNLIFIQRWLESRRYLSWYSLSFALLHLLFLFFSKFNLNSTISIYAFFFGLSSLILLFILSFVYFPWISERLQWNEYHFLTSYLGPFALFLTFIHVYLYWNLQLHLFNYKFLSLIFPSIVLILRLIIYGILHPIQWIKKRKLTINTS